MSKELAEKLGTMSLEGIDVTDSNDISKMLGYDTEMAAAGASGTTSQGETTAPAPAASAPAADAASAAAAAPAAAPAAAAPAPAPAAAPAATDSSATPAATAETTSDIAGVLTKDGKHVIPHSVLRGARLEASMAQQRARELEENNRKLQEQIRQLQSGETPNAATVAGYTPEQLEQMRADFPALSPLLDTVKDLQAKVAQAPAATTQQPSATEVATREADTQDEFDRVFASLPLLAKYRDTGGVVWNRAVELDAQLTASDPAYANLDTAGRFARVQADLAAELGVAVPAASTQTPPAATTAATTQAATAAAPAPAAAAATPQTLLPTLTDLGGGTVSTGDPMSGMSPGQMVDKAMNMSMDDLRKMAGLTY